MAFETHPEEQKFWNQTAIVEYFADKPADPVIVERLSGLEAGDKATALDLGCGGGRHSQLLALLGYEITAVDFNPAMLAATRSRLGNLSLHGHFAQMSIEALGLASEQFDAVVSTGVLHQAKSIAQYAQAVSEVARVLKPAGLFTGNIFTASTWDETYQVPNMAEPHTVVTQEGLWMTLLPKADFYRLMSQHGLQLEREVAEDVRQENTGPRSVLRAHFIKNS